VVTLKGDVSRGCMGAGTDGIGLLNPNGPREHCTPSNMVGNFKRMCGGEEWWK